MKPCIHRKRGNPSFVCDLGLDTSKCRGCSSFQYGFYQEVEPVSESRSKVGSSYTHNTTGTIPQSTESAILQQSATNGGCGCRRR